MSVVGHDRQKQILSATLSAGKLLNGYIFSGKEGIGKKRFAMDLAKSILCSDGSVFSDCECSECKIGSGHPDFKLIDETPIKIDVIRDLNEYAQMTPFRGRKKVCIIDNVHEMGVEASNAFLKTLEEPGEGTIFILITHRYEQLLPTIRSRCVKIEFSRLTDKEVVSVMSALEMPAENTSAIEAASGSVSVAIRLSEGVAKEGALTPEFFKNKEAVAKLVISLKDKDDVRNFIMDVYMVALTVYHVRKSPKLLDFSNYLLDISKRLEYNVNFDIFKMDLLSKLIGVLSEDI